MAIDASFFLKVVLPEKRSDQAERLWMGWIKQSVEVFAPSLFVYEVSSVLRNKIYRKILSVDDAEEIITQIKHLDITLVYTEDMLDLAWNIGLQLNLPTLYDCFYIALSKFIDIPLWTADSRLYSAAKKKYSFIHLI